MEETKQLVQQLRNDFSSTDNKTKNKNGIGMEDIREIPSTFLPIRDDTLLAEISAVEDYTRRLNELARLLGVDPSTCSSAPVDAEEIEIQTCIATANKEADILYTTTAIQPLEATEEQKPNEEADECVLNVKDTNTTETIEAKCQNLTNKETSKKAVTATKRPYGTVDSDSNKKLKASENTIQDRFAGMSKADLVALIMQNEAGAIVIDDMQHRLEKQDKINKMLDNEIIYMSRRIRKLEKTILDSRKDKIKRVIREWREANNRKNNTRKVSSVVTTPTATSKNLATKKPILRPSKLTRIGGIRARLSTSARSTVSTVLKQGRSMQRSVQDVLNKKRIVSRIGVKAATISINSSLQSVALGNKGDTCKEEHVIDLTGEDDVSATPNVVHHCTAGLIPRSTATNTIASKARKARPIYKLTHTLLFYLDSKNNVLPDPVAAPVFFPSLPLSLAPTVYKVDWKPPPPRPTITVVSNRGGITFSWTMDANTPCEPVKRYQVYAIKTPIKDNIWKLVDSPVRRATKIQYPKNHHIYIAVRAVDIHSRCGPFSSPAALIEQKDVC